MSLVSFTPSAAITAPITATQSLVTVGGFGTYLRIANIGAGNAYVAFFDPPASAPTVTAIANMCMPPGAVEVFSVPTDVTQVAVIGDATGTSLNVTRGNGQ